MKLYGTRRLFARGGVAPPLTYLLHATFDADDVGYANGQVLDTEPEMGANFAGQLTVTEVAGTIGIVTNECLFTSPGGAYNSLGFYSQGVARAFGYGLLFDWADTIAGRYMVMGWSDAGAVAYAFANGYAVRRNGPTNTLIFDLYIGGVEQLAHPLFAWALTTDYSFAMIFGGYDVNGVPWRSGQVKANYLYGVVMYVQGGAWGGDWHLLWRCRELNTATMYAMLSDYDAVGTTDEVRVPDLDLSGAYVINNYSTFDAANGTSLDAITPEVGGGWTEYDGTWDIQGNEANLSVAPATGHGNQAMVDSGLSDGVLDVTITPVVGNTAGVVVRYDAAGPTFWFVELNTALNRLKIYDYNGGFTQRVQSGAYAMAAGNPYHVTVSFDGQRIDASVDDAASCSWAAAALNEAETEHGLYGGDTFAGHHYENFVVYPKTSATYDTILDAV